MIKSPALSFAIKSFLRLLLITPFNIFFMVIPGLVTFILIALTWAVTIVLFAAVFLTPVVAFQTELISLSFWSFLATFSTSLFAFFASAFLGIIAFLISKHFAFYIFDYLRWNYKFIFRSSKADL